MGGLGKGREFGGGDERLSVRRLFRLMRRAGPKVGRARRGGGLGVEATKQLDGRQALEEEIKQQAVRHHLVVLAARAVD